MNDQSTTKLAAIGLGAIRTSARGVVHLVYEDKSVAWFGNGQNYRVFWPYPSSSQKRQDLYTPEEVRKFLLAIPRASRFKPRPEPVVPAHCPLPCLSFDWMLFVRELESLGFSRAQQQTIYDAAHKVTWTNPRITPATVQAGDLYKSTRGVRLVVRDKSNCWSLVSLKAFDKQYEHLLGQAVGGQFDSPEELKAYMTKKHYEKLGRMGEVDLNKVMRNEHGETERSRPHTRRRKSYHDVVTLKCPKGETHRHRRTPCAECPWRRDAKVGAFPAEAYRISAKTAYGMGQSTFACHMAGSQNPATCAGFLLRGAVHSMIVRMATVLGRLDPRQVNTSVPLYDSYREMAEANGVDPDDPILKPCRGGKDDG